MYKNMHNMSTNFAKTLFSKHGNDVKLWRHKQRAPNANDHHMTLNQTPPMKGFCVRHWRQIFSGNHCLRIEHFFFLW